MRSSIVLIYCRFICAYPYFAAEAILLFDNLSGCGQGKQAAPASASEDGKYHNFRRTRWLVFAFVLSQCRAGHKSKLNALLSGSQGAEEAGEERASEGKCLYSAHCHLLWPLAWTRSFGTPPGTAAQWPGQININHCVIIFCCQLNSSKVFIIHK